MNEELLTTLSNLKVNEPIAKEVFTLPPIPAGTLLHDRIDGTRYPIDQDWKPIGKKESNPIISLPIRSDGPASDYHAQSEQEPRPWWTWLLPAAAAGLAAAGLLWLYRRRQTAKQAATES